ncbi:MAG: sterol desaturase family protein [Sphingomonadales bacterium]|nr:sterol desaturase family protein [Sphingomonadales bacterium]
MGESMISKLLHGDVTTWVWALALAVGIGWGVTSGFLKARKIQPRGFKWSVFRNEIVFGVLNATITGFILGTARGKLEAMGWITTLHEPAAWWRIAGEYVLYFVGFDTYFYWLHRWMHVEPVYTWVHKLHHRSTAPNLMTTLSVSPLESVINGGYVILFLLLVTCHAQTVALILPTNIIMGLYVHSGYEFLPRWWNKSWATKWFISATFHDQHHRYFTGNFGGYTTVWDRLCGTMRPKFERDFEAIVDRRKQGGEAVAAEA